MLGHSQAGLEAAEPGKRPSSGELPSHLCLGGPTSLHLSELQICSALSVGQMGVPCLSMRLPSMLRPAGAGLRGGQELPNMSL